MTLEKVRTLICSNKGKRLDFRYNGVRNQVDEFSGVIVSIYPSIFVVKTNSIIKSFSYTDVLIGSLEIKSLVKYS